MTDETQCILLPGQLKAGAQLATWNQQLRRKEISLDWAQVTEADTDALQTLLGGLDLSADGDRLGLDTVPEALMEVVGAVFEGAPQPKYTTPADSESQAHDGRPKADYEPGVWTPSTEDLLPVTPPPVPKGAEVSTSLLKAPSQVELRAELERKVTLDLLGPAGGPHEEVPDSNVRDRYLVGILAPKGQAIEPELETEVSIESDTRTDDGASDSPAAVRHSMWPSSIGLTFSVAQDIDNLEVTASWGAYKRIESPTALDRKGRPLRVWKRKPRENSWSMPVTDGRVGPWSPDDEQADVVIEGLVRDKGQGKIVTLFFVNGQTEPKSNRDAAWVFQPKLKVSGPGGAAAFRRRPTLGDDTKLDPVTASERAVMGMLYRHSVEFAVGHGTAVRAHSDTNNPERAHSLETMAVPVSEVLAQQPPKVEEFPKLAGLVLDMKALADSPREQLTRELEALPKAYEQWILDERANLAVDPGLKPYQDAAVSALERCDTALERIRDGLSILASDDQAADAFCFANRAMYQQRIHSIYSEKKRRGESVELKDIDVPENRTWRTFQIAFILLNLPSVTVLHHRDRTHPTEALADLLWFPTGGGKTEAYLGLAAYTMGLRRLQGTVSGRSGAAGVAVLMRYTLRLLTLQQFQRATTLMCACEVIRRAAPKKWGNEPFRVGLWVGRKTTPNTTAQSDESLKQLRGQYQKGVSTSTVGSPDQLKNCPWCGAHLNPGKNIVVEPVKGGRGRTLIYCGDRLGKCAFSKRQAKSEGLPVVVVDEEIYRRLPTLLIATVDKFAQLPWNGATQMLFGRVNGYCSRHGYRSPEIKDADTHKAGAGLPKAKTEQCQPLRPPDLIIQDELHLISGPLGTLTGLYETAVDELCSWTVGGKRVRPKVIASTATIRRASEQVHNLFLRKVQIFPPHGTDARNNFFSIQRSAAELPGRRYLGICAPGRKLKSCQIRVYTAFLAAAQSLYKVHGRAADPWMTMVAYFNSMRELAGARRLIEDDVRSRLRDTDQRGLAKRKTPVLEELTSRKTSNEIPTLLDRMEIPFDPKAEEERRALRKEGKRAGYAPLDALLATNMISVGVDVKRLGLMVTIGQPKTTAEYIQATSRVGRNAPGLVCTLFNWARPRDLSHYETFEHYHETFYKHVEALSVTPFAPRALDRGLTALLVALIRLEGEELNANEMAAQLDPASPIVTAAVQRIVERAEGITDSSVTAQDIKQRLLARLDLWKAEAAQTQVGSKLGYKQQRDGVTRGLLKMGGVGPWSDFTCPNSLRDVEPTVGLILDDGRLDDEPQVKDKA